MPVKAFEIPKYVQIVRALEERISSGRYGPGDIIPSESALVAEFGASRPIVVRALSILEQDGWIEARRGSGRFVLRSRSAGEHQVGAGRAALGAENAAGAQLVSVSTVPAPTRAAVALGLAEGTVVVARVRLLGSSIGPVGLVTTYIPEHLAQGTQLARERLLTRDPIQILSQEKGIRFDYARDRISARHPTPAEATLLGITRRDVVLTILVTAFDNTGTACLAADAVVPTGRMELEDSFPLA